MREKNMICDHCGQEGAKERRVSKSYGKGASLFVIENVPVVSCSSCGVTYLSASTLHEIHRIKLHRKTIAKKKNIPVARFQVA